jgi:hypothetical protein
VHTARQGLLVFDTKRALFTFAGRARGIGISSFDFSGWRGCYTKRKHWRISWFPDGDR